LIILAAILMLSSRIFLPFLMIFFLLIILSFC
jgi:hypothetical protein